MSTIQFKCPKCGYETQLPSHLLGQSGSCPACKEVVRIEAAGADSTAVSVGGGGAATGQVAPQSPYQSIPQTTTGAMQPHRGTLILVLGLVGFLTGLGFILGPLAWILGKGDLKKMKDGRMDPSGRDITKIGYVFGLITTILYLIVVLLVVGLVVVSFVMVNSTGIVGGELGDSAMIQMQSFETPLKLYKLNVGAYPTTDIGLDGLITEPAGAAAEKWRGPYFNGAEIPSDPWGNEYQYSREIVGCKILCVGEDGVAGTYDDLTYEFR